MTPKASIEVLRSVRFVAIETSLEAGDFMQPSKDSVSLGSRVTFSKTI